MKFFFYSSENIDLATAIHMASGQYNGHPYRAGVCVGMLDDQDNRKYGVEAWIYPRQIKFGTTMCPAQVQIGGLSGHDVDKARERLACYSLAIAIADFVNRAATEGIDLGKVEDSGLLWESTREIQDAIDAAQILLLPHMPEDAIGGDDGQVP